MYVILAARPVTRRDVGNGVSNPNILGSKPFFGSLTRPPRLYSHCISRTQSVELTRVKCKFILEQQIFECERNVLRLLLQNKKDAFVAPK